MSKEKSSQTTYKERMLRIRQVLEMYPVSRATWWNGIRDGIYPAGIKLSTRTTAWKESDILALIDRMAADTTE